MFVRFRFILLSALLLGAVPVLAQTRPEPTPPSAPADQQVLTVRVTLPTVVGYAIRLFTKEEDGEKPAKPKPKDLPTSNPVLTLTVPLPQLLSSRKSADAPPKKD